MIKAALLFLAGVVLGAVVGVATNAYLATKPAAATPAGGGSGESYGKSIEDAVTKALRRVQAEAAAAASGTSEPAHEKRRRSSDPAPVAEDDAPKPAAADRTQEILDAIAALGPVAAREEPAEFTRDTTDPEAPPARVERVLALHGWEHSEAIRRKWLFVKESAALAWFGTPESVDYDKNLGLDQWYYRVPVPRDGEPENTEVIQLEFRRGRLVYVDDYSDD
jgi:hypothetical protein